MRGWDGARGKAEFVDGGANLNREERRNPKPFPPGGNGRCCCARHCQCGDRFPRLRSAGSAANRPSHSAALGLGMDPAQQPRTPDASTIGPRKPPTRLNATRKTFWRAGFRFLRRDRSSAGINQRCFAENQVVVAIVDKSNSYKSSPCLCTRAGWVSRLV